MHQEQYTQTNVDDRLVIMEFHGPVGAVERITIGSRFEVSINIYPTRQHDYQQAIDSAFDFFKNYVMYTTYSSLKNDWLTYQRASELKSDSTFNAFFNLRSGLQIRFLDRKKSVFEWVKINENGELVNTYYHGCTRDDVDAYLDSGLCPKVKLSTSVQTASSKAIEHCAQTGMPETDARIIAIELVKEVRTKPTPPKDLTVLLVE